MVQRHQVFVVARVCVTPDNSDRRQYRCIAALHHEWCYGRLPLQAVNLFKRLTRVPANAALIEEELATYYKGKKESKDYPCPYTAFLVEAAFCIDLTRSPRPILSRVAPMWIDMGSTGGVDNNDGLTILDVTKPRNPSYCYVSVNQWGFGSQLPLMTPLRAAEYLRSYRDHRVPENPRQTGGTEWEMWNLEAVANLDDMPLIPMKTLGLVWPGEYGRFADEEAPSEESGPDSFNDSGVDALRQQASLSSEDVALLTRASKAEDSDIVNLSRFPLTPNQLFSILGELGSFRRLDVSYNSAVGKDVFLKILKAFQDLSWINIMHCPISRDDLIELASTEPQIFRGSIGAIIHPAFFLTPGTYWDHPRPSTIPDFPIAFRLCIIASMSNSDFEFAYLPFFRMDELVQNLTDLLDLMETEDLRYGGVHASILASALRRPDQSWQDRYIQLVPGCSAKMEYEPLKEGYELLIRVSSSKDVRYGVFPPLVEGKTEHAESDMLEMAEFLERLKDEGAPVSDESAAKRLVELCSKMRRLTMECLTSPRG
ncbi:hypothetical protein H1R20_g10706, partial [Candolleomyces eurysporus]